MALAAGGVLTLLAGCGGGSGISGGGGTNPTGSGSPSAATRAKVFSLQRTTLRTMTQSGFQSADFAAARNGAFEAGAPAEGGARPLPLLGAFLRNVASVPPSARAQAISRMKKARRSISGEGAPTLPPEGEMPTLYFDEYLGLWVEIAESMGKTTFLLYEDAAKTRPAGKIETLSPADGEVYPQTYENTYRFEAGLLRETNGFSKTTLNENGSGSTAYENVYRDGGRDRGQSAWTARGDVTWSARTDAADGYWTRDRGTWRADGSGSTHSQTSDGYTADYTYNADGSGRGKIAGPVPGLPATVTWDPWGNTSIRYSDGTVENYPGYGLYEDGSGPGGDSSPPEAPDTAEPTAAPAKA